MSSACVYASARSVFLLVPSINPNSTCFKSVYSLSLTTLLRAALCLSILITSANNAEVM